CHQGSGDHGDLHSFPTRRSSDLLEQASTRFELQAPGPVTRTSSDLRRMIDEQNKQVRAKIAEALRSIDPFQLEHLIGTLLNAMRSEEHTSELQSRENLVCRLLLE